MEASPFPTLDALVRRDPGDRGVARLGRANPLEAAARALLSARSVLLVTGFPYLPRGVPETDGVMGSLALAEALATLGVEVHFLADPLCRGLLEELEALPLLTLDLAGRAEAEVEAQLEQVLAMTGADLAVAVERPGRGADGRRRNMRGQDLGDLSAPLDQLFLGSRGRGLVTVAIGDGGNEVGMGSLTEAERETLTGGRPGASVVPVDHLIVAGISDWGAFGLAAGLAALTGRDLLPEEATLAHWMQLMLEAGAVDGVTGAATPSVDGRPLSESAAFLGELKGSFTLGAPAR